MTNLSVSLLRGFSCVWSVKMQPTILKIGLALLVLQGAALAFVEAAPRYQVINLGSLGAGGYAETFSGITGQLLNNAGMVAAGMETTVPDPFFGGFTSHAFLWANGVLRDLGTLAFNATGNFSQVFWLNDLGHGVGIATYNALGDSGEPLYNAAIWKDGQIHDLGTLGGKASLAHAVNNHDQAAGWALNQAPAATNIWEDYPWPFGTQQRAVLWDNGQIQDLGTLGGPGAWASAINDKGQIIGQSYTDIASGRPKSVNGWNWSRPVAGFIWEKGQMTDLGNVGGTYMLPTRINSNGEVIGFMSTKGDSIAHGFLWKNGLLKDLGTFGGSSSSANAINDSGEIVGGAGQADGAFRAFLWRNGVMTNLGTLSNNSQAWGINSKTQVVGTSGTTQPDLRAFLWDNGGSMLDLNKLVPTGSPNLATAIGINERGEILCGGPNEKGLYLLVPLPSLSLQVSKLPAGGNRVEIAMTAVPGKSYRLESSTDLKTWAAAGATFVSAGESVNTEVETQTGRSFYRVAGPL